MAWSTLSDEDIDRLVEMCVSHPDQPIVLPGEAYTTRKQGRPIVRITVDGLRVPLHRVLYDKIHAGDELGSDMLMQDGDVDALNVNPLIMHRVARTDPQQRTICPNGHEYAVVGTVSIGRRRCRKCYEEQLAKARVGGVDAASANRAKTHCPRGHEYTPENTLHRPSDKGRRRCRTCEQERKNR